MDNLGVIRLFVEAASFGGLSAAGRKLGLSPAAASARLFKLEATLGVRLFERTTRHLRLTDEGRTCLGQKALCAGSCEFRPPRTSVGTCSRAGSTNSANYIPTCDLR